MNSESFSFTLLAVTQSNSAQMFVHNLNGNMTMPQLAGAMLQKLTPSQLLPSPQPWKQKSGPLSNGNFWHRILWGMLLPAEEKESHLSVISKIYRGNQFSG